MVMCTKIKKIISILILISFIFSQSLHATESTAEDKSEFNKLKNEYHDLISEYKELDNRDIIAVANYAIVLSLYTKGLTDPTRDILTLPDKEQLSSSDTKELQSIWQNLLVLQWKIAEYLSLVKTSSQIEGTVSPITSALIADQSKYLDSLFSNYISLRFDPNMLVNTSDSGNVVVNYKNMDPINYLSFVNQDGQLNVTGPGFDYSYIRSMNNWDNLEGIINNYKEKKDVPTLTTEFLYSIIKNKSLYSSTIRENFTRTAGTYIQSDQSVKNKIKSYFSLMDFYDKLYSFALYNAVRLYVDNLYMHSNLSLSAVKAPIYAKMQVSFNTGRSFDNYSAYKALNTVNSSINDQITLIQNDRDSTFKKQSFEEMAREVNSQIIPEVRRLRKELLARISNGDTELGVVYYRDNLIHVDQAYYDGLKKLVNDHKLSRFIYADDSLRAEFFGDPVFSFKGGRTSVDIDPLYQNSVKDIRNSITDDEMEKAFTEAQDNLWEYIMSVSTSYQKIVAVFLSQKISKNINNIDSEVNNAVDKILEASSDIIKTSPVTSNEVFTKYGNRSFEAAVLIDNYEKHAQESEKKHQEIKKYFSVAGVVVGAILTITFVGSEIGVPVVTTSSTALSAASTVLNTAFTAYMGYTAVESFNDYSAAKGKKKQEFFKTQLGEEIDPQIINNLTKEQKDLFFDFITNTGFTFFGVIGSFNGIKLVDNIVTTKQAANAMADIETWIKDFSLFSVQELKGLQAFLGDENMAKFWLYLHRYFMDTKLVAAKDLTVDLDYFQENITYIQRLIKDDPQFAHTGLGSYSNFKQWFSLVRFKIRIEKGRIFYDIATEGILELIKAGELTKADATVALMSPEMILFLDIPANVIYKERVLYELSFRKSISMKEAENYLKSLKSPEMLPGYKPAKPSEDFYRIKDNIKLKEEFGKFASAKNWNPALANKFKNEQEISQYCYVDSDGFIKVTSCKAWFCGGDGEKQTIYRLLQEKGTSVHVTTMNKNDPTRTYGSLMLDLTPEDLKKLPDELTIVEISWDDNRLNLIIQTRGYQIIKDANLTSGLDLNGVNMDEVLKIYFTIVEPNKQISDCFHSYIGILNYINKMRLSGSPQAKYARKYIAILRRMLWPATNGLSPIQEGLFGRISPN